MVTASEEAYFKTTESGFAAIKEGLDAAGKSKDDVGAVLDFGCGYGRIYRIIAAAFPNARLTACDLMGDAVEFCANTFGGTAIKSTEDVGDLVLPDKYDLIWVGSVFTHIPEPAWTDFLDMFAKYSNPGCALVFTSHGVRSLEVLESHTLKRNPYLIPEQEFARMKQEFDGVGFSFSALAPGNYRATLERGIDVSDGSYGFSCATREWIESFSKKDNNWTLSGYAPAGWGNNHDVVTLTRNADKKGFFGRFKS